jgi:peroxiredoxin
MMKRLLAGVLLSAALVAPAFAALKPGAIAPDFTVKAALAGQDYNFSLKNELKKGPVVLYFFPAAFTAGCTLEAHLFAEATDEFKKQGATVIGVTAGNIERVAEFSKSECRDKFAVAADPGAQIAKQFDAVSATRPNMSSRTSFVIGKDGKILEAYTDANPNKHVEMTMAAVKAAKG